MSRQSHKFIAWASLSALLFLQLAVSAYACDMASIHSMPHAASSEAPMPCDGPAEPSKLCEQHCLQSSQSVDTQPHGTLSVPTLCLLGVVRNVEPLLRNGRRAQYSGLVAAAGPPPLLRFGVLRI